MTDDTDESFRQQRHRVQDMSRKELRSFVDSDASSTEAMKSAEMRLAAWRHWSVPWTFWIVIIGVAVGILAWLYPRSPFGYISSSATQSYSASPSPSPIIKSLTPVSIQSASHAAWLEIVLKLLDWPFVLAVTLIAFVLIFRRQLTALLNRGDIQFSWGDGPSIRLRDLADKIDQELDPLRDEVEALQQAAPTQASPSTDLKIARDTVPSQSTTRADALRVMKDALANPKFRWRSVDRLAAIAYLSEPDAAELLRSDPEVVFGFGRSKKPVARLKSR
jgi:hypothetical protein